MHTLGMLASPGTWSVAGGPLVGRTVANSQFLKALLEHSSFEELALFIGETADLAAIEKLTEGWDIAEERVAAYSVWQLPELLARGRIDVLHHASHVERLVDLVAVRDRYAARPVPITGQIHSLSYPRLHQDLARQLLVPPSRGDALFCSSTAGRLVVEKSFAALAREAKAAGFTGAPPTWELPVVPLGVEADMLARGDRNKARKALELPDDAVLLTCLARFTEADKLDLFPLMRVLQRLVQEPVKNAGPVYLLLAGARQGTKTPEMLELWAKHLGVGDRLKLRVDFPEAEKRDLLAASDLFVSPVDNVQETFGQSVVEAMAAGLPVVVSDFDGYKDTVDDTVGVRVPTRLRADWSELSELGPLLYERPLHLVLGQSVEVDLTALERALRFLVANPGQRQELGDAARARARTRYDWKVVIGQFEAQWRELSARAAKPSGKSHPLKLDFGDFFSHYASPDVGGPEPRFVRAEGADEFVIYPELKHLFVEEDVRALLHFASEGRTHAELVTEMKRRLVDRREWIAGFVVGWLRKQGLLRAS